MRSISKSLTKEAKTMPITACSQMQQNKKALSPLNASEREDMSKTIFY